MWNFIFVGGLLLLFIFLFFRQDRIDHKALMRRDREGDLHIMKEMKKFFDERGQDSSFLDESILELEKEFGIAKD